MTINSYHPRLQNLAFILPHCLEQDSFLPDYDWDTIEIANPDQDVPIANPARTPFGYHRFIANDFHCLLSYCFYVLLV